MKTSSLLITAGVAAAHSTSLGFVQYPEASEGFSAPPSSAAYDVYPASSSSAAWGYASNTCPSPVTTTETCTVEKDKIVTVTVSDVVTKTEVETSIQTTTLYANVTKGVTSTIVTTVITTTTAPSNCSTTSRSSFLPLSRSSTTAGWNSTTTVCPSGCNSTSTPVWSSSKPIVTASTGMMPNPNVTYSGTGGVPSYTWAQPSASHTTTSLSGGASASATLFRGAAPRVDVGVGALAAAGMAALAALVV